MVLKKILFLAGLAISLPLAAELDLQRVWPAYRTAASFTTIAEYFGRNTTPDNPTALRTQPDARDGYYWLTRVKTDTAHAHATIRLEVTRDGSTEPAAYAFDWNVPTGSNAVYVGLTGRDWRDPNETPIAWRLTILAQDGTILAASHSFLWAANSP
jgi:hypothetical protein